MSHFNPQAEVAHEHDQGIAAYDWPVNHKLGYKPAVSAVYDSNGQQWDEFSVEHIDNDNLIIHKEVLFSGTALLS